MSNLQKPEIPLTYWHWAQGERDSCLNRAESITVVCQACRFCVILPTPKSFLASDATLPDFSDAEIWTLEQTLRERWGAQNKIELQFADADVRLSPGNRETTECPEIRSPL